MKRMVRALDRYVFVEFWKIFVTTALGFPILVNIIDLTDNLDKYLGQHLTIGRIALSYLYWLPDSMFMETSLTEASVDLEKPLTVT